MQLFRWCLSAGAYQLDRDGYARNCQWYTTLESKDQYHVCNINELMANPASNGNGNWGTPDTGGQLRFIPKILQHSDNAISHADLPIWCFGHLICFLWTNFKSCIHHYEIHELNQVVIIILIPRCQTMFSAKDKHQIDAIRDFIVSAYLLMHFLDAEKNR